MAYGSDAAVARYLTNVPSVRFAEKRSQKPSLYVFNLSGLKLLVYGQFMIYDKLRIYDSRKALFAFTR